ncbi:MAG TPA: neuromedin U [Deltaproteobacteria bacterium]|nr:neuromedin U [Deltaproteobacteria bacterium]
MFLVRLPTVLAVLFLLFSFSLHAQDENKDLAKKSQNPASNLTSLQLENDFNFPVGPTHDVQYELDLQLVLPVILGPVNLVHRLTLPIATQAALIPEGSGAFGLGDIVFQMLISTSHSKRFFWGAGPMVIFPTATDSLLGQGKFSLGPLLAFFSAQGPWVGGLLVNNVWSTAGDESRPGVNQMQLQPSLNYNFKGGWFLTSTPTFSANWKSPEGSRWTLPLGGGGGRVFHVGKQPLNLSGQIYYNALRPPGLGKISGCVTLQFLFPKKN